MWKLSTGCADEREEVWNRLEQLLRSLPRRHALLLAGDFNAVMQPSFPHVGPSLLAPSSRQAGSFDRLGSLMALFDLCVLNSWAGSKTYTFRTSNGGFSAIDYVAVRREHADPQAKKSVVDLRSVLVDPGAAGIHYPILGSVPALWRGWARHDAKDRDTGLDLQQLRHDCTKMTGRWPALHACLQEVAEHLPRYSATELNQQALSACKTLYSQPPRDRGARHHEDLSLSKMRDRQWLIRRELHKPAGAGVHAVFRRWWLVSRLSCPRRESARRSKRLRRQKLQEIFWLAMEASSRKDMSNFYRMIRRLAPKKTRTRMALRDASGTLMGASEEGHCLRDYLAGMFVDPESSLLLPPVLSHLPIGASELEFSISHLPVRKSVPQHCVPTCVWKSSSQMLTPWLMQLLRGFIGTIPNIPVCWRESWVVFVPKSGKSGHDPQHWRPICLQGALGKSVLTAITLDARNTVLPQLVSWPQFAYLPGRGTYDAISRVIGHCEAVRSLVRSSVNTIYDRRAGLQKVDCVGGMQILVDLSGAFDRAPRKLLQKALEDLPLSDSQISLLLSWHLSTPYHFKHAGQIYTIECNVGVRQGCVAAPFLWVAFVRYWHKSLVRLFGVGWVNEHLTVYADDNHLSWVFTTPAEVHRAMQEAEKVLLFW